MVRNPPFTIIMGIVALMIAVGSFVFTIIYSADLVITSIRNECSALIYITEHEPVNQSQSQKVFYNDITSWAHKDGCM